jgi:4-hydroxybenzoyl-CoA thioesterase
VTPSLSPFAVTSSIRFQHCDPAGIAFFARLDELLNAAFEDWCAAAGLPFATMMRDDRHGFPLVHATIDYRRPLLLGDAITITHTVLEVGQSSVTFAVAITSDSGVCVEGRHVRVFTSLDTHRAVPLPTVLRDALLSSGTP